MATPTHCRPLSGFPKRKHEMTTEMNCRNVITLARVTAPKQKMVYEMANCDTAAETLEDEDVLDHARVPPHNPHTCAICAVLSSHAVLNTAEKHVVKKIWFRMLHGSAGTASAGAWT